MQAQVVQEPIRSRDFLDLSKQILDKSNLGDNLRAVRSLNIRPNGNNLDFYRRTCQGETIEPTPEIIAFRAALKPNPIDGFEMVRGLIFCLAENKINNDHLDKLIVVNNAEKNNTEQRLLAMAIIL